MRHLLAAGVLAALALCTGACASTGAPSRTLAAAPAGDVCPPASPRSSTGGVFVTSRNFGEGALTERQCQVETLRWQLAGGEPMEMADTRRRVGEMRRLYEARAGRQQAIEDGSSAVSVTGGIGLLAGAGTTAMTESYWGALALAPIVFSQINAYEPTRDLFHGGGVGLDLITGRYETLSRGEQVLSAFMTAHAAPDSVLTQAQTACDGLEAQRQTVLGWADETVDRALVGAELQRVQARCAEYRSMLNGLGGVRAAYAAWRAQLPAMLAADALHLDTQLVQRDRELRYTPIQTVSRIVAAPFRTVETLLTGENSRQAIDSVRTQAAFSNMDLRLSNIDLPALPPTAPEPILVNEQVQARENRQGARALRRSRHRNRSAWW